MSVAVDFERKGAQNQTLFPLRPFQSAVLFMHPRVEYAKYEKQEHNYKRYPPRVDLAELTGGKEKGSVRLEYEPWTLEYEQQLNSDVKHPFGVYHHGSGSPVP